MRFEEPVLLYGAGREALSSRAILKSKQPDLKVYVTVDSGTADIPDAELMAVADLPAAIAARRFGLDVKIKVSLPGVDEATAKDLIAGGHHVCPYSNAVTKGLSVTPELA